ncbi:MAG: S1C family serine protease [Acidimicrobiales bacterium]
MPDDGDGPGDEEALHKGWISPEDRLWRHPSELAHLARAASLHRHTGRDVWRERRGPIVAGTLGAAAVAAAAAVVLSLANAPVDGSASKPLHASDTSLVTVPSATNGVVHATSALRASLVELEPAAGTSGTPITGVVLPGGYLIVTSAFAAGRAKRMEVVTSNGKHLRGNVVATDESAGVAVVSTNSHLSGAPFADEVVAPGELALAACLNAGASPSSAPATDEAVAMIRQVGRSLPSANGSGLMDAIEAETPLRSSGEVLLDDNGDVIGILNRQENAPSGTVGFFVPSALALDVANELASLHHIDHGWIGVTDSDAPDDAGAQIDGVSSGSPAATAGLEPGDVVTAVDGHVVLTYEDLEARLYTILPGRTVDLTLERAGSMMNLSVIPAAASSP